MLFGTGLAEKGRTLAKTLTGDANRVLHAPRHQRFVDLRLREGRVGPEHDLLAQLLLPLDLGQQQFFPVVGAVSVTG